MSTPVTSQPATARWEPRRYRRGGFVMSPDTARAWAARLLDEDPKGLDPIYDLATILKVIHEKVRMYRVSFHPIGEDWPEGGQYMLVTQSARFNGYRGMDPNDIPQFEEGEREAIARPLLENEGVMDYEFKTVLAGLNIDLW